MHQDSEKADGLLGTLVITLPSSFTGGEFVVSHQGQTVRAGGSQNRLGMVAFYADCHHEVRPVKQGYRVVLTYNLIAQGATRTSELPQQAVTTLASELHRFWQTSAPPRWDGDTQTEPPDRLVYLLDHNEDHPALGDLIDSEVELRHWLAPDGSKREDVSFASEAELCMNRLSVDCAPFSPSTKAIWAIVKLDGDELVYA